MCPTSSSSPGEGSLGECLPKKVSSPGSHSGGTGEGEGLSGRDTECGHLRGAPRVGAGAWDGLPQEELKNSILSFLPQPEPSLPDKGSKGLTRPRIPESTLRELGGVGAMRGESLDEVSCTGRGRQHHQLSQWGCVFGGKVGGRAPLYR